MPRHPQRHLLVDLQQRRVGMRRHQIVEHGRYLGEQPAERSSAVMVLAKSGVEGSWMIAAISAEWSTKACSKAGRKCSGMISANGGVANGVSQAFRSGLAAA